MAFIYRQKVFRSCSDYIKCGGDGKRGISERAQEDARTSLAHPEMPCRAEHDINISGPHERTTTDFKMVERYVVEKMSNLYLAGPGSDDGNVPGVFSNPE